MANYNSLKATVNANIKANNNQEITGPILNSVLTQMINSLGAGYQYMGVATPSTNPGTPDQNVFYLASTAGTYTNFGGTVLTDGEIAILKYNGAWSKDSTGAASSEKVSQLGFKVDGIIDDNWSALGSNPTTKTYPISLEPGNVLKIQVKNTGENSSNIYVAALDSSNNRLAFIISPTTISAGGTTGEVTYTIPSGMATIHMGVLSGRSTYEVSIIGRGVVELAENTAEELSVSSASLTENATTLVYKTILTNAGIRSGEKYAFVITGTHSGSRILVRANSTSGSNIQDFCEIGKTYFKVAGEDINSLLIYHNGDIDIKFVLNKNLSYSIAKNTDDIQSLEELSQELSQEVIPLNEEVFDKRTNVYDSTGSNPTYIEHDFYVKKGDSCTVKLKAATALTVSVIASEANNATVKTIYNNSMSEGQVYSDTFIATASIYRLRISFTGRGILEITTTAQSLKKNLTDRIDNIEEIVDNDSRLLSGVISADVEDNATWDTSQNYEITNIHGNAYDLVKFKINNLSDYPSIFRLLYRDTHLVSHSLGDITVDDKAVYEGIFEIPEDFVSVLYQRISTTQITVETETLLNPVVEDNLSETSISSNVLDMSSLVIGKYVNTNGVEGASGTYCHTDFIPVKEGQVIVLTNDVIVQSGTNGTHQPRPLPIRYIAAYGYNKNIIPVLGLDLNDHPENYYTKWPVPHGVYYIKVSAASEYINEEGARINTGGLILPYEEYWYGNRPYGFSETKEVLEKHLNFPLTSAPDYILNTLSYKPLGALSKGYLCVSDDDGSIGLGTYTLPMVMSKGVPVTFFLMSNSDVLMPGNEQYKNLLIDAVQNYGCSVGQHGAMNWTDYNEKQLFDFFVKEKAYWDNLGVSVKSAACPSGFTTKIIESVAGGFFGVHRGLYDGINPDNTMNYHAIHTDNYACIPRTNLYCLPSQNIRDNNLDNWKNVIDWVVENKLLLVVYFHDFDFVETAPDYQARRELLEGFLDYAKTHITMVNAGDIPRLV